MLSFSEEAFSLESVRHQQNTKFFDDLVKAMAVFRTSETVITSNKSAKDLIKASKIEAVVRYHSGLNIQFKTGTHMGINAYVFPPHLDKNHALLSDLHRQYYSNKDAKQRLKSAKGAIQGTINLEEGKVSGVFSSIVSEVFVAAQILQGELFTDEEAAAILAHELGHLMTYYEYLGQNVLMSHVMGDAMAEFTEATTDKQKIEIYKVTREALGLDDDNSEVVTKVSDGEVFKSLMVSDVAKMGCSATNTPYYDLRTWEALADQFVSRIGGGRALAVGLDKIFRLTGSDEYKTNVQYLITESFRVLFSVIFLPFVLLFVAVGSPFDIYDPPMERLERIRRDMILAMKNPKADTEYRRRLKADVEVIDELLAQMKDRQSILMSFWKILRPKVRNDFNRTALVQELEALKDNNLYVHYNTLKAM